MSSNYELWCNSFIGKENKVLHMMENFQDIRLFKVYNKYESRAFYYNDTPVFAVWMGDTKWIATTNYLEAYGIYKNAVDERKGESKWMKS